VIGEVDRLGHVLPVVAQWLFDRLRHHDHRRHVHHRADVRVVGENLVNERAVGDVALVEDPVAGELDPAGDEIVENDGHDAVVQTG
jgi:hypothetical protein